MIQGGKKAKMSAVDSAVVKLKSRSRTYKGKQYVDFVGSFVCDGKTMLISLTKERGKEMIYPVRGQDGQPVKEKYGDSPLHIIYARVTELTSNKY
jgi:hypothetical protein